MRRLKVGGLDFKSSVTLSMLLTLSAGRNVAHSQGLARNLTELWPKLRDAAMEA